MIDLDKLEARLDAANAESGPWSLEPDKDETVGLWIEALGDGGEPGEAAALFLRDIRETVLQLITELRPAREVVSAAWRYRTCDERFKRENYEELIDALDVCNEATR